MYFYSSLHVLVLIYLLFFLFYSISSLIYTDTLMGFVYVILRWMNICFCSCFITTTAQPKKKKKKTHPHTHSDYCRFSIQNDKCACWLYLDTTLPKYYLLFDDKFVGEMKNWAYIWHIAHFLDIFFSVGLSLLLRLVVVW